MFSILNQKNPKKHFTNVVNHWLLLAFRELAHLLKIFIIFLFIIKYIEFFVVQNTKQSSVHFKLSLEKFAPLVLELSFAHNMAEILSWGPATWLP